MPETVIDDVWEDNNDDTSDDSEQSEVTVTTHIVQYASCYMYFKFDIVYTRYSTEVLRFPYTYPKSGFSMCNVQSFLLQ